MSEWLDTIHDAMREITDAGFELEVVSESLSITGNSSLAKRLDRIARNLMTKQAEIGHAIGTMLSQQNQRHDETMVTVLRACLAPKMIEASDAETD